MVYVKSGFTKRRYYRKKYYKKNTLKKGNIFKNKTAKSQAGQIYALKKKVNNLAYHIKPETIIQDCVLLNRVFTTDGVQGSYGVNEYHNSIEVYKSRLFSVAHCNYAIKGTKLRPYNFTIYGEFGNKNFGHVMNDDVFLNSPLTGYLRIIVCKLIGQQGSLPFQITRSLQGAQTVDFGLINGPLVKDVTSSLKIVANRVIKIDNQHPSKMFKIVVKNPGVVKVNGPNSGYVGAYDNDYMIYFQYFCPDALLDDGHQVSPIHYLQSGIKFAFVDTE